ncbi:MAG TPA: hypothetical protein VLE53_08100 [Gemmatimonadaceae bacterium]|nr:hypothetical protein [Gemmatimonadaceae bacterium]
MLDAPGSPFDGGPYERLPAPLGRRGTDLRVLRRRAIAAVLVTWVPLAVLSAVQGLAIRPNVRESFLLDISAYGRYVVALPLLILSERIVLPALGQVARHIATSGLLLAHQRASYDALVTSTRALMCSPIAGVVILVLAYLTTTRLSGLVYPTEISTWAAPIVDGVRQYSFAGWWRLLVSQPLYAAMLGVWIWRALVWAVFLHRATRLDLRLVAAHPDHMGGLEFVVSSLRVVPIVGFAVAAGTAANIAELVVVDGRSILEFNYLIGFVVVFVLVLFVGPLFTLRTPLLRLRLRGIISYGELATDLGHRFEARWVRPGRDVDDEALERPDFSAVTDAYSIIANVSAINPIPITVRSLAPLVGATLAPFVPVLLLGMPAAEILKLASSFLL